MVINIRTATGSADEVYIGRAGHGHDGYFGNPVAVNRSCPECGHTHDRGGSTLRCYRDYLLRRLRTDTVFRAHVRDLNNKTLVCFCKPAPCHGDILAAAAAALASGDAP